MSGVASAWSSQEGFGVEILGESPALRRALALAERFARTSLSVLLQGATGTGKELFARRIHERSGRTGRFVPVNCGARSEEHTSELQSHHDLVCRLLLEKKKTTKTKTT